VKATSTFGTPRGAAGKPTRGLAEGAVVPRHLAIAMETRAHRPSYGCPRGREDLGIARRTWCCESISLVETPAHRRDAQRQRRHVEQTAVIESRPHAALNRGADGHHSSGLKPCGDSFPDRSWTASGMAGMRVWPHPQHHLVGMSLASRSSLQTPCLEGSDASAGSGRRRDCLQLGRVRQHVDAWPAAASRGDEGKVIVSLFFVFALRGQLDLASRRPPSALTWPSGRCREVDSLIRIGTRRSRHA